MLARVATFAIDGIDPRQVWVEVDIRSGLPAFTIVGLGDAAVRESRDRVRSAIAQLGLRVPADADHREPRARRSCARSGPGSMRRSRSACSPRAGRFRPTRWTRYAVFGELSLSGELRDSPGALAVAEGARRAGLRAADRPARSGRARRRSSRSSQSPGSPSLRAAAAGARRAPRSRRCRRRRHAADVAPAEPDLADIRGHAAPLLALEIAAAGGHNLLFEGAPGTGKTMLARRLPSILPPMTRAEAIEVTRIHSIAGLHAGGLVAGAAVPGAAPHDLLGRAGGRRCAAAAGRSDARPPRRPVSRRARPSSSARASTRCASRSRTAA